MESQMPEGNASVWGSVTSVIKRDWKTIPNILSYFRLLLIPVIVYLYVGLGEYRLAAVFVVISGVSDVADGIIARHFNMVSDFGKVLDPAADKLTQIAMFICLSMRYSLALVLVVIIVLKEFTMFIMGLMVYKRLGDVHSARWFGKAATFIVILTSFVLILFPDLSSGVATSLLILSVAAVTLSFILYFFYYLDLLRNGTERK